MQSRIMKLLASFTLVTALPGCGKETATPTAADYARRVVREDSTTLKVTPQLLREKLKTNEMATFLVSGNEIVEANLFQSGIHSVDALKGLPLRSVDLGMTQVTDLSPLTDMQLELLILENTPVSDISVVKGMPLSTLKLQNTKVTDFTPLVGLPLEQLNLLNLPFSDLSLLKDMPLNTLWLTGTQIQGLTDLPKSNLVSLDLANTKVAGLEPIAGMTSLRRLNIAETQVTDLTPLQGLQLERIVLSPERIQTGIEHIRAMKSLTLIQTTIDEEQTADAFWKRYDLGVWKSAEPQILTTPAP
jgi:internalin A